MSTHNDIMLRGLPPKVVREIVRRAQVAGVIQSNRRNVARAIRWYLISTLETNGGARRKAV